jgi:hypothetical protein
MQTTPQKSREETAGKASLSGSALDFLAHFGDSLAHFVNGIVDSSTGTLGWASGAGATDKYERNENEQDWLHCDL